MYHSWSAALTQVSCFRETLTRFCKLPNSKTFLSPTTPVRSPPKPYPVALIWTTWGAGERDEKGKGRESVTPKTQHYNFPTKKLALIFFPFLITVSLFHNHQIRPCFRLTSAKLVARLCAEFSVLLLETEYNLKILKLYPRICIWINENIA